LSAINIKSIPQPRNGEENHGGDELNERKPLQKLDLRLMAVISI
jgi:hypothetical protein